jgi:uncharacterized protein (TIGR02594 family)
MAEPAWMAVARALIGVRETPGPANSPKIMKWASDLGAKVLGIAYPGDATPWCGLFVAHCVNAVGVKPAPIAVRASAWATWGSEIAPRVGAVLVFMRPGGGHVGFYVAEDATTFHVLGGNQGDAVSITRIDKRRVVACRWPMGVPLTTQRNVVGQGGGTVSRDEA